MTDDLIFTLAHSVATLAGHANDAERRRADLLVRALRAEAQARVMQMERDYWRDKVERQAARRRETLRTWRARRKVA